MKDIKEIFTEIIENPSSQLIKTTAITRGQFVRTGLQMGPIEKYIGFCVQIRRKEGACGSDQVFLRHADGNLTLHENQCFFALNEAQERKVRGVFESLPEEEDYTHGYSIQNQNRIVGFMIEKTPENTEEQK